MPQEDRKLKEYKKYVTERLGELIPIFQRVASGDFSSEIKIPEREDEFTPLIASLSMVLDDLKFLDKENKEKTEELEEGKTTLEIKVKARTKELQELARSLEEKVEARTKDIEKRAGEIEKSRVALMNILEDVEDARSKTEEERDKTKAIIANFADGLIVLDKGNKITLINSEGEKLLDVKSKELEGKFLNSSIEKTLLKKIVKLIEGAKNKADLFREELSFGKEKILEVSTNSLTVTGEKVIIIHDISREKLVERMKTEFVSLAAHQLRTPLSGIKWVLKMMMDGDIGGELTQEQKDFLQKAYTNNERMIMLINDLLDVTRIEEGKYLYKLVSTDIESVVRPMLESYKDEFLRAKVKTEFKKPARKLPKVKVDVEKIRLVFQNLIENALRYTPAGGTVEIFIRQIKDEIEISFKDTGLGIPADQQERVFTKFFRAVNAMKFQTEGSGLGLFISKNIVEAHDGRIWFESEEGKGTTFYIALPIQEEFEDFLKKF